MSSINHRLRPGSRLAHALSGSRRVRGRRVPRLEPLERRELLAASVAEFPLPSPTDHPSALTPGLGGALWFTTSGTGQLGEINLSTGMIKVLPTGNTVPGEIAAGPDQGIWFTDNANGAVGRADPITGKVVEYALPAPHSYTDQLKPESDDNLWFTVDNTQIGKIVPSTGQMTVYPFPSNLGTPLTAQVEPNGTYWFVGTDAIAELDPNTGETSNYTIAGGLSSPFGFQTAPNGNVWFVNDSNQFIELDPNTGTSHSYSSPEVAFVSGQFSFGADGSLWFFNQSYDLARLDPSSGTITQYPIPMASSAPIVGSDGNVWFSEPGANAIAAVNPTTGQYTQVAVPTAQSSPSDLILGPDGNLWFTELDAGRIGKVVMNSTTYGTAIALTSTSGTSLAGLDATFVANVTSPSGVPTGTVTFRVDGQAIGQVPISANGSQLASASLRLSSLAVGTHTVQAFYSGDSHFGPSVSDVYIQRVNATQLGTPTFQFHSIPVGFPNSQNGFPAAYSTIEIATGPDGNLWLANQYSNEIDRLNPTTGAVTIFGGAGGVGKITAGPGGNLWFTEPDNNAIGRIDPTTGAISVYPIPTEKSYPWLIVAGTDGSLWFDEYNANKIGRLNSATGAITEYTLPAPGPAGLAATSDGNLWYTSGNAVHRLDPTTGTIADYPLPNANTYAGDLVVGPDGDLWFAQNTNGTIGSINPTTGVITEQSIPNSGEITRVTAGRDGVLWFTDNNGDFGSINPATGATTLHVVSSYSVFLRDPIVLGPDGKLWFDLREPYGMLLDEVASFDPATGSVSSFGLAGPMGNTGAMATGTDGALWFLTGSGIGRADTSGAITQFAGPPNNSSHGLTATPDGGLWITEPFNHAIGRINPITGAVTDYPLPNADAMPEAITVGPGGTLWFTDPARNEIVEFNPATATFSAHPAEIGIGSFGEIIAGPDGSIWYSGANAVGRFNLATGAVTVFPLLASRAVDQISIAFGADGRLWYAEGYLAQIGALDPTTGATTQLVLPDVVGPPLAITADEEGRLWFATRSGQLCALDPVTGDISALSVVYNKTSISGITAGPNDTLLLGESDGTMVQVALPVVLKNTRTFVTLSTTLAAAGQPVVATTVVLPTGSGVPTGQMEVLVDGYSQAYATVSAVGNQGTATFTIPSLAPGPHTISAIYDGDNDFSASQSTALTVVVLTSATSTAPALADESAVQGNAGNGTTTDVGSDASPIAFSIPLDVDRHSGLYYRLFDVTNPVKPVLLAGPAKLNNGTITVKGQSLADGVHKIAYTTAFDATSTQSATSLAANITVDTSLKVVSVAPSGTNFFISLPNNQVVVTFNHPLVGLTPDDPTGFGVAAQRDAVSLIPRGSDGTFATPSGIDFENRRLPATLVYHVNADGTSTITLIPRVPLGTDVYRVTVNHALFDRGLNFLTGNTPSGDYVTTFELRLAANTSAPPKVVSVTTLHASVGIHNNTIPQPDTIAIGFNKPLDFLTINTSTVQLLAGPANMPVAAAVAYSPTTRSIDLTPGAILIPGTVYTVRVSPTISDDHAFPSPGSPLGSTFTTTFQVAPGVPKHETRPLSVLSTPSGQPAVSPGTGVRNAPFGYVSIPFSEPVAMASLRRDSVMLTIQAGGLKNTAFDAADPPLNTRLAFNPNTNELIVVPTVLTGSGLYMLALGQMRGTDGSLLTNRGKAVPVYASFQVKLTTKAPAVRASTVAHELVAPAPTAPIRAAAETRPILGPVAMPGPVIAPKRVPPAAVRRSRPAQPPHRLRVQYSLERV